MFLSKFRKILKLTELLHTCIACFLDVYCLKSFDYERRNDCYPISNKSEIVPSIQIDVNYSD
jgi:hypothetical protein